jgi:hypothetical protein
MNNIYGILFIILGTASFIALIVLIRWVNDATFTGWRLRRWHERSVPQVNRMWLPWFAWRPVKTVTGEVVWLDTVYRQIGNDYTDMDNWTWYYYGTIFETLKETQ